MAQRIKGQEVSVRLIDQGRLLDTVTDVRSFEVAAMFDLLREGYLGETSDRRDEVFRGVRGKLELHFENADVFNFIIDILNRAIRRSPGTRIDIHATLNFPNGDQPRVQIRDAFFGEVPINFGSRVDYGQITLDFESQDFSVL